MGRKGYEEHANNKRTARLHVRDLTSEMWGMEVWKQLIAT